MNIEQFFNTIKQYKLYRADLVSMCHSLGIDTPDEYSGLSFHKLRYMIAIASIGKELVDTLEFKTLWVTDLIESEERCRINHQHLPCTHFVQQDINRELAMLDIVKKNLTRYTLTDQGMFEL